MASLDALFQKVEILDVVSRYTNLKERKKGDFWGISPFVPGERSPSFHVRTDKHFFKCFSSGIGGGVVKFIEEVEGISKGAAIKYLADMYGVRLDSSHEDHPHKHQLNALSYFAERWHDNLFNNPGALEYLVNDRQLSVPTIELFGIGLCDNNAISSDFTPQVLIDADILSVHENRTYDTFFQRITFPIRNISGTVVGFSGRIYLPDDPNKKRPKYRNTRSNGIFHKDQVLYGLYEHRDEISKHGVVLMEGQMGVCGTHEGGMKLGVGTMGTSISPAQANLIKRFTDNAGVMRDGDLAGHTAIVRDITSLVAIGIDPVIYRIHNTGQKTDPDDLRKMPGFSPDPAVFPMTEVVVGYLNFYKQDISSAATIEEKMIHIRSCINTIASIPDPLVRAETVKLASETLEMPQDALYAEVDKIYRKSSNSSQKQQVAPREVNMEYKSDREYWIAYSLLTDDNSFAIISDMELRYREFYFREFSRFMVPELASKLSAFSDGSTCGYICSSIINSGKEEAMMTLLNGSSASVVADIMESSYKKFEPESISKIYRKCLAEGMQEVLDQYGMETSLVDDPASVILNMSIIRSFIKFLTSY